MTTTSTGHGRAARRWRTTAVLVLTLLATLVASLVAPAASAAAPLGTYRASSTPATVPAGDSATVTVRITNSAPLGSLLPLTTADITVPAGLTATAARVVSGPRSFTATIAGATVRVRSSGLPLLSGLLPGASVDVAITLDAPAAGTFTFATTAAGPLDLLLLPFSRVGPEPVLTVTAPAPAALRFGTQPTSTVAGAPITPAVTVTAVDAAGNPATGFTGVVTIGFGTSPGSEAAPGGNTATAVDGVATFGQLTVPSPGLGYTLVATAGALTSPPSSPFDVGSSVTACAPGSPCDSGTVTAADGTADIRVQADSAAPADRLTVFFDGTVLSCQQQGSTATFNVSSRSKTITYTSFGGASTASSDSDLPPRNRVCFGSPTSFPTAGGGTAVFNPANKEFEGLLPECVPGAQSTTVTDPCVVPEITTFATASGTGYSEDASVVTVLAPVGDPRMTH